MIAVIVFTDGRLDLLAQTIESFDTHVDGPIFERWVYDDSGDPSVRSTIESDHPEFTLITHPSGDRQGFAGAVRTGWEALREHSNADWVFHLEDDFLFRRPIHLEEMIGILKQRPSLAQLSLMRQPWSGPEIKAGGVVNTNREAFTPHLDRLGREWLEHTLYFTTNPSLYHAGLISRHEWPEGAESEGRFGIMLRRRGYRFGVMGTRDDEPWVEHIGATRTGEGY